MNYRFMHYPWREIDLSIAIPAIIAVTMVIWKFKARTRTTSEIEERVARRPDRSDLRAGEQIGAETDHQSVEAGHYS